MKYNKFVNGDVTVIGFAGNITSMNSEQILDLTSGLIAAKETNIVFDFSRVDFIDSSGLGNLVGCLRRVKKVGGEIKISGLSERVRLVFELIRLHQLFDLYEKIEDAVSAFQLSETR
jgi:anti-sigma B factor antagonist